MKTSRNVIVAVLLLTGCDAMPDEPSISQHSPEGAVAAAFGHVLEVREGYEGTRLAIVSTESSVIEALGDAWPVQSQSVIECEPSGEMFDMEAGSPPLEIATCRIPSATIEISLAVKDLGHGMYRVVIRETTEGVTPGLLSVAVYRVDVTWGDDGWDLRIDPDWGTEI